MSDDRELESFKVDIDLRAYAREQGYELDQKESWRGSSVMRHSTTGDKIIVKRDADGHYVYFSVHRDGDGGSIIDFVQNRERLSLGSVRKELRPWLGKAAAVLPAFPVLPKTAKDRIKVETAYARMQDAQRHPYLENERCIPGRVLEQPRFAGRVRIDGKGNAIFPHFDEEGLCGYEIKNHGFTGFASGGTKGLWFSRTEATDTRLVVCEGAIDALSYATLFPDANTRYASIGGQMNGKQPELVRKTVARLPESAEIVSAMDADIAGRSLTGMVGHAVELTGRRDLRISVHEPQGVKDWNDQLRKPPRLFLPYCPG